MYKRQVLQVGDQERHVVASDVHAREIDSRVGETEDVGTASAGGLAFAFHSDAGTTLNDSIIGTLGIYQTDAYNGVYANGASRYLSHDLTDLGINS